MGIGLLLEPLEGDLTRVGRLDEADYGFTSVQVRFTKPLFEIDPKKIDQDIVVFGDSFSMNQDSGWENDLVAATGASIAAFSGTTWDKALDSDEFHSHPPKVVILEVVERLLKGIARTGACPVDVPTPAVRIDRPLPDTAKDLFHRRRRSSLASINLSYSFDFMLAAAKRRFGLGTGGVGIEELRRPLFSSARSDELLFLKDDLGKGSWQPADLEAISCGIRQFQDRIQKNGRTLFLAMLVPDKLSAYSDDLANRSLANLGVLARLNLRGINLLDVNRDLTAAVRAGQLDVYLPDDTHLSSEGYAIVSRAVVAELRRRSVVGPR